MLSSTFYTTKIVDIQSLQRFFDEHIAAIARDYSLSTADATHAYDWCVTEALTRTFQVVIQSRVEGHYRHDVYRCVYDTYGSYFESYLRYFMQQNAIGFAPNQPVKAMVAGGNLFVAQGVPANARF